MALLPSLLSQALAHEKWLSIRAHFEQNKFSPDRQKEEWDQCWAELWVEVLMPSMETMLIKDVPNFGAYLRLVTPLAECLKRELRAQLFTPKQPLSDIEQSPPKSDQWWQVPEIAHDGPERVNRLMGELSKVYGYSPAVNGSLRTQLIEDFWRLNLAGQRSEASLRSFNAALGKRPARQLAHCVWLPFALHWVPGFLAVDEIANADVDAQQPECTPKAAESESTILMRPWWDLANSCGGVLFADDVVFICDRPTKMDTDDDGMLHNTEGPAILYSDGFQGFAWHGSVIAADLISNPGSVTVEAIEGETNVEMRRVLVEIYGLSRYLVDSGADIIHQDSFGTLYRKEIGPGEPLVMVRVKNATAEPDGTFRDYFLRVPPNMVRAQQAVAWTFGLTEEQYLPAVQS